MPWLARLDARAVRWSRPRRWTYLFFKWNLVAIGAYALTMLGVESLQKKEPGIGLAWLVYLAYTGAGLIYGVLSRRRPAR